MALSSLQSSDSWSFDQIRGSRAVLSPRSPELEVVAHKDQSQPPLLKLPAELRNKIYFELLTSSNPRLHKDRRERARGWRSSYVLPSLDIHPAILATCRQARNEATDVLYSNHVFGAHPSLLTQLPYLIDPSKPIYEKGAIDRIKRWWICLRLDTEPRFDAETTARAFSGMDELSIEVWEAQYASCDYTVLKLFANVRGVKKAQVTGSVAPRFANWLERVMMSETGAELRELSKETNETGLGLSVYDLWVHGGR